MSKQVKEMQMQTIKDRIADVRDLVLLKIVKLPAQTECSFRAILRKKNAQMQVVKNSLTRRVFRDLGFSVPDDSDCWAGPTALVWGPGSIAEVSRAIDGELKGPKTTALYKDKVTVKGAIADGQPITFDQALKMPTREEAISQILAMILGPGSGIAGCLAGPGGQIASQIKSLADKEETSSEGESASDEAAPAPAAE